MRKMQIVKISSDGKKVSGIYADYLQGLGEIALKRASLVEFNEAIQKWVVEMKIGPFAEACLLKTFDKREDALKEEVKTISYWHERCLI